MKRARVAAAWLLAARVDLDRRVEKAVVGAWTFPYRRPRGTASARVERIEGAILYLSDGTSMHVSHFAPAAEGEVAL